MRHVARFLSALAFAALLVGPSLAQTPAPARNAITPEIKRDVMERVNEIIRNRAFVPGVDFSKWKEFIEGEKPAIDEATTTAQFVAAVNRAFSKFGLSHIQLTSPEAAEARRNRSMVGLGVQVEVVEEGIRIVGLIPKGPAEEAGLLPGDLIIEADGQKPTGRESLIGDEGTKVRLKIKRGDAEPFEVEVTRRRFSTVIPESVTWPHKNVAVVRIPTFDLGYNRQRVEEVMAEARKADAIILDLRMNGGGAVINLLHLAGFFLPERATMGTFINRAMVNRYVRETGGKPDDLIAIANWATDSKVRAAKSTDEPYKGRVVVLVNEGTGSASEMMAAALRELTNAPLIGRRTAGAVLASVMAPLPHGFQLQFPFTDYVTVKGMRLENNGLVPDVEAPTPRPLEPDRGIEEALKWLQANGIALKD